MFKCFNPRARVGRDDERSENGDLLLRVSIHAPAWGATTTSLTKKESHGRFNPRARVGRDQDKHPQPEDTRVSIHAPAWGATMLQMSVNDLMQAFQSTRPRGARHSSVDIAYSLAAFQSTRPRGARRACTYHLLHPCPCFNPRARVGRDFRQA